MHPDFLGLEEVLLIHSDQINRYGGGSGLRDAGLLASAVEMPQATFDGAYLHRDLFEMAAAYLFHLVQNHPFLDGNKRVGAATALVFLDMNGVEMEIGEDELVEHVLAIARHELKKDEIAKFLREHAAH